MLNDKINDDICRVVILNNNVDNLKTYFYAYLSILDVFNNIKEIVIICISIFYFKILIILLKILYLYYI